jgi:hypothetical protein
MEHRRRRDGEFRRAAGNAFQKAEVVDHDRPRVPHLAGDDRDRRLLFRTAELGTRVLAQRDAFQLRKEIEVPPLAAELAVGDALQADRLLPGDDFADGFLIDLSRTQQAADVVGAERRINQPWLPIPAPPSST